MIRRRSLLLGTAASAACAALALPARRAIASEGEWIDLEWTDAARARAVPVRLYPPSDPRAPHPAPLVLFSHGLGGSRMNYSYLGRYLASQGIASLHVQHVGSDRRLWIDGSPMTLLARIRAATQEEEVKARALDVRFALDQLLAGPWQPRINPDRVVVAGHSYGANTSLLLAGATVQRERDTVRLADARVRAAVLISAPPFFGEASDAQILSPITVPSLHVTATEDVIRIPGYYSGVEDRLSIFEAIGSPRKCLAVFQGGAHSVFTDRAAPGGYEANRQIKAATCQLVQAFLRHVLDDDASAMQAWPGQYPHLVSRFEVRAGPGPARG